MDSQALDSLFVQFFCTMTKIDVVFTSCATDALNHFLYSFYTMREIDVVFPP